MDGRADLGMNIPLAFLANETGPLPPAADAYRGGATPRLRVRFLDLGEDSGEDPGLDENGFASAAATFSPAAILLARG